MRAAAWIILALALIARLLLVFNTASDEAHPAPVPSFNDEPAHLNYVRYLYLHNSLPVQRASVQDSAPGEYEYYQPPLYYFLARPFYALGRILNPGSEIFWVRSVSVLFSLAGLLVLYSAVRGVLGIRAAVLTLMLGSFGGIPLRFGSLASPDSLLFALVCLEFGLVLAVMSAGADRRLVAAAILVGAAGLWTKASFLLILPLFPLALYLTPKKLLDKPERIWFGVAAILIPLLSIIPWYLWNYFHYGRLIPLSVGFGPPQLWSWETFPERLFMVANYFTRSLVFPYDGWWGSWADKIIYPLDGLAFLLLVLAGFGRLRWLHLEIFRLSLAGVGLVLAGYIYINLNYSQAEARHLLPAMPFIFTVMALGALSLQGRKRRVAYLIISLWILLPWATIL